MRGGRIVVRQAKTRAHGATRHNWIVEDSTGGKVFTRQLVFSFFGAAIREAHRLAETGAFWPTALESAQKIYPRESL